MSANGKRFLELLNKREKHEGARIANMQRNLAISLYAVRKNFEDLSFIIAKYDSDLEIWDVKNRDKFEVGLWELHRLLQNYLSSIYSLIEHNVQFCKDLNCAELNKAYQEKKDELLNWDCAKFVRDLRTFSEHIGLPLLKGQIYSSKTEYKQSILLQKDKLLKWRNWSHASKRYIASKKELELIAILREYQGLIKDFYHWFYEKTSQIYKKQLTELAIIDAELEKVSPSNETNENASQTIH
jgi:hypothetical protein